MEDKDWLKGLENKLKDYEEPAPEGLWEDIESSVFPVRKRRVIAMPVLWRSVAAAAVVALGVFAGLKLNAPGESAALNEPREALASGTPSSVTDDRSQESPVEIVRKEEAGVLVADAGHRQARRQPVKAESLPSSANEAAEVMNMPKDVTVGVSQPEDSQEHPVSETVREEPRSASPKEMKKTVPVTDHDGEDWSGYISATDDSRKSGNRAAELGVSFSEGAMSSRNEDSFDLQMFYRGSAPASDPGLIGDRDGGPEGYGGLQTRSLVPKPMKNSSTVDTRSNHKRPVKVALTVNYPIGGVFGVETGAVYTRLRSTFVTEVGRTSSESEQTLSYIGVPLDLTASFFKSKMFSVYVSGGGMVEKCVSGKTVTSDMIDGALQGDRSKNSFNVKPLLWSLNASAGLQANLTKNFGIYVEPGVSYHFDDGSDVRTIYKDRPFDFALTFGARFSFGK